MFFFIVFIEGRRDELVGHFRERVKRVIFALKFYTHLLLGNLLFWTVGMENLKFGLRMELVLSFMSQN